MLRAVQSHVLYSIGHRGFFLLLLGLAFIFYGASVIRQPHAYAIYPYHLIPWATWGWIWIATGLFNFIGAFRIQDRVSFTVATMVSALWSVRWFVVAESVPHENLWSTGLTWTVITGIILIVSTWPEVHVQFDKDGPHPPSIRSDDP